MRNKILSLLAAVVLVFALGSMAKADTIRSDCANNSCQGGYYTLTYNPTPESNVGGYSTYDVTLTIDTSGYTGGGLFINDVAVKISDHATIPGGMDAAPGTLGNWFAQAGGLNSSGCNGTGSGYVCADDMGNNDAAVGGTLAWTFDVTVPNSDSLLLTGSSIKVRYVDANNSGPNGGKVGALVSEDIPLQTTVPEPGTLTLLGTGLLGLVGLIRRRLAA